MMRSLRKRHLQVWSVWAVLLPAGIVLAWLAIPGQPPVTLLQSSRVTPLPVIKQTKDAKDYTASIRSDKEDKEWQLEWKNKTPLLYPSAVIYKLAIVTDDVTKGELVGRIEARGDYLFPMRKDTGPGEILNFVLYDFIHEKIIDTLNFQP